VRIYFVVLVTACTATPAPPPVVAAMSPTSGPYGTTITITGTGFGAAPETGSGAGSGSGSVDKLEFTGLPANTAISPVIVSWSDTQIVARAPFPAAAGTIEITAIGGTTETPVFTPDGAWTPGDSASLATAIDARRFDTTTSVLGFDASRRTELVTFGATTATFALDGIPASTDPRSPTRAKLVAANEVLATNTQQQVIDFTVANGTLTATDTGMTGTLLAADPDGAWLQTFDGTAYQLSHAKRGTPWAIDRGPIKVTQVLDAQLAADGTLVVVYSHDDGDIFDNMANVGVARLAPGASTLSASEYPESQAWDDYIASAQLRLAPDGARMIVDYSTQEYDQQVDVPRQPLARTASGAWSEAAGLAATSAPLVFTTTTTAALDDSTGELALVPDIGAPATAQTLPLWPAWGAALVSDGTTLRPIVQLGDQIWAPTPPAQ
jgi:hypothetical protein